MADSENTDHVSVLGTDSVKVTAHSAGAQVSSWESATFGPLIFSPPAAQYGVGNSPHGGIPVCFPWFGDPAHSESDGAGRAVHLGQLGATAKHGFVRSLPWNLLDSSTLEDGTATVRYGISEQDVPADVAEIIQPFAAELTATFADDEATLSLTVTNTGDEPFYFEEALHTYFRVGDVNQVEIDGLDGLAYSDKTRSGELLLQRGPITFGEMVDSVFPTENSPVIIDRSLGRKITIANKDSGTTIVWNPGPELGEQLPDLAPGEWKQFVCVETANAKDATVYLPPGQSSTMAANYTVSKLED